MFFNTENMMRSSLFMTAPKARFLVLFPLEILINYRVNLLSFRFLTNRRSSGNIERMPQKWRPRLVTLFFVPTKLPDCLTDGSMPLKATNCLAFINLSTSPISPKIIGASVSPISGMLLSSATSGNCSEREGTRGQVLRPNSI